VCIRVHKFAQLGRAWTWKFAGWNGFVILQHLSHLMGRHPATPWAVRTPG